MIARDRVTDLSIRTRIWQLAGIACITVAALCLLGAWNLERSRDANEWVRHTQTVLGALGTYSSEIVDAETGQRGYLLTQQDAYLPPYRRVLADHEGQYERLNALIQDGGERVTLSHLEAILNTKLAELGLTIQLAKTGNLRGAVAVVREGRGRRYTVEFQRQVRQIADNERDALAVRQAAAARLDTNLLAGVVIGGMLAILLIVGAAARTTAKIGGPLRELMLGISALAGDDLGGQIEVRSYDEIGRVAAAFNNMSDHLLAANRTRERVEAALRRSNEDLDSFAYSASHDLKAPLRGIRNLTEWIAEDLGDSQDDETRENLALLQNRVERLDMLLDSLLRYSRVGRSDGEAEDVDVARLVAEIVDYLAPGPGFTVTTGGTMPIIRTNRVPLEQVLRNLIGNGLKHHDRDTGKVIVSARDIGEKIEFRVEDDGSGIPSHFHERIFEMFQTLRARDELEGSGMGLAIVKKSVENYGGTIRIESAPPRRGTAFIFTWQKNRVEAFA